MIKLLTVVGARPQIIKSAAISRAIRNAFQDRLEEHILHTGQHYDPLMSGVFFGEMGIPKPHYQLNVGSGAHGVQTARMLEGIERIILETYPDALLVYGDTNSTLAGALAASKCHLPVIHVEAGLRSFDKRMPEEINRIACDHMSTLLFSPTLAGIQNLEREGFSANLPSPHTINRPGVYHCGDIMFDNTLFFSEKVDHSSVLNKFGLEGTKYILATIHRDSNTDDVQRLKSICRGLMRIAESRMVVMPAHPRTEKAIIALADDPDIRRFRSHLRIHMIEPVSFLEMLALERHAELIITDSGGVQKEAYFLRKPGIVLRPHTEWVEIVKNGNAILADADLDLMVEAEAYFRNNPSLTWPEIFGDGRAAEFICETICHTL